MVILSQASMEIEEGAETRARARTPLKGGGSPWLRKVQNHGDDIVQALRKLEGTCNGRVVGSSPTSGEFEVKALICNGFGKPNPTVNKPPSRNEENVEEQSICKTSIMNGEAQEFLERRYKIIL